MLVATLTELTPLPLILDTIAAAVLREDMRIIEHNRYRKRRVEVATYYVNKMPSRPIPGPPKDPMKICITYNNIHIENHITYNKTHV